MGIYGNGCIETATRWPVSRIVSFALFLTILIVPVENSFATSAIRNAVVAFCAPNPTVPDLSGSACSVCHSSANPSLTDLTAEGIWAQSQSTYSNFCPAATNPPPPAPAPTPTPPPPPPVGMSPVPPPPTTPGMGGSGASVDDDDEGEMDDDDDGSSVASSLSQTLRALRTRLLGTR